MIKRNWRHIYTLLVAFSDFMIFNLSFYFSFHFLYSNMITFKEVFDKWLFVCLLYFPVALSVGMYRGIFQLSLQNHIPHLKKFSFYLALFTMSYIFLVKTEKDIRFMVIIFLIMQYLLLTLNHYIFNWVNRTLINKGYGRKNTIIVGNAISALNFSQHLKNLFGEYYHIIGFVSNGTQIIEPGLHEYILGTSNDLSKIIEENDIDQIFIISKNISMRNYNHIRKVCQKYGINAKLVTPLSRNLMKQANIKDVTGIFLAVRSDDHNLPLWHLTLKYIFDKVVAIIIGILLLPVAIIITIIIKLSSKGPVLLKQKRTLYKNGPVFTMYKFRISYEEREVINGKKYDNAQYSGTHNNVNEGHNVMPIGKILAQYKLDDLPQLINVLKNEMSIIGPRPLLLKDFDLYGNELKNCDWYIRRGEAKPGITGLCQVSRRNDLSFEEMCLLDLYYIENQSVFLDLEILFETIPAIITNKNNYSF